MTTMMILIWMYICICIIQIMNYNYNNMESHRVMGTCQYAKHKLMEKHILSASLPPLGSEKRVEDPRGYEYS